MYIGDIRMARLLQALTSCVSIARISLEARICLLALCLLVLSLGTTATVIGINSSRQTEASTMALARSGSREAAGSLETAFRTHLGAVLQLASIARRTSEATHPPTRDQLDDMIKGFLSDHPDVVSAGFIWEPNALDGRDAEFAGQQPRFDETGRYKVLWHRKSDGSLLAQPLQFMTTPGGNDWYEMPKRTGRIFFTEPYAYPVDGKEVSATSLIVPIMVNGKFRGVVYADFTLNQLGMILVGIRSVDGADMALISNGGLYAAHSDATLLQKPAQDIPEEGLRAVRGGRPYEYEDEVGVVHLLQPVVVHRDMPPWAVRVSFPKVLATQAARDLMRDALVTAAICAAVATGVLVLLLHRLMSPLRASPKPM
ncbi:Methyl-accepting chemotaxis protein McpU [Pandoraea terrae]|uniref:Methyl-accepting chemotaxis protein McpU n=1 Tax=Pandoraea terrae TaxID=1537710 RepID=A0A5E4W609_9BURK|nr:cache domain-containing protein [Pandoraea terrae]VVE19851.1 Methyl-accepting chemotaxis protein McpU [Pandoraea terrae]